MPQAVFVWPGCLSLLGRPIRRHQGVFLSAGRAPEELPTTTWRYSTAIAVDRTLHHHRARAGAENPYICMLLYLYYYNNNIYIEIEIDVYIRFLGGESNLAVGVSVGCVWIDDLD